ncbi:Peptidase family M16, partial [Spraguea lophii 42_110]
MLKDKINIIKYDNDNNEYNYFIYKNIQVLTISTKDNIMSDRDDENIMSDKDNNNNHTINHTTTNNNHTTTNNTNDNKDISASCVLIVSMGGHSDPNHIPGLAHFLEHMLFMGTKKYKSVNAFDNYLAMNNGYSNAYTSTDTTCYYFKIDSDGLCDNLDLDGGLDGNNRGDLDGSNDLDDNNNQNNNINNTNHNNHTTTTNTNNHQTTTTKHTKSKLKNALDMFAQFFINPLFNKKYINKEILAVDSEFKNRYNNDNIRIERIENIILGGIESKFTTGNKYTLRYNEDYNDNEDECYSDSGSDSGDDIDIINKDTNNTNTNINIRKELIKLFKKYSKSNIVVVLQGNYSTKILKEYIEDSFKDIKHNNNGNDECYDDNDDITSNHINHTKNMNDNLTLSNPRTFFNNHINNINTNNININTNTN